MEGKAKRLLPQFLGNLYPNVISFPPRLDFHILLSRYREVTAIDRYIAVQAGQKQGVFELVSPVLLQALHQLLLRVVPTRECAGCASYLHGRSILTSNLGTVRNPTQSQKLTCWFDGMGSGS